MSGFSKRRQSASCASTLLRGVYAVHLGALLGLGCASRPIPISSETSQAASTPDYFASRILSEEAIPRECRNALLRIPIELRVADLITWPDYRRAMLYAQAWRVWFDWSSAADAVARARNGRTSTNLNANVIHDTDVPSRSNVETDTRDPETTDCVIVRLLADSALLGTLSLYANAARYNTPQSACQSYYAGLRDRHFREAEAELNLARQLLQRERLPSRTTHDHYWNYVRVLTWVADNEILNEIDFQSCRGRILACVGARAAGTDASIPCQSATVCSSPCCGSSLLTLIPDTNPGSHLMQANSILSHLAASNGRHL